jgi:hypothetical protein
MAAPQQRALELATQAALFSAASVAGGGARFRKRQRVAERWEQRKPFKNLLKV